MNDAQYEYKIFMPHRHTLIYSDEYCDVSFEIEVGDTESVLWEKSAKFLKGDVKNLSAEIDLSMKWLSENFPKRKVVLDRS